MKLKICQYFALVLLGGLALASCKENDIVYNMDDVEDKEFRSVSLAMPLGKIQIPLYETLQKEMKDSIRLDANGVMYVEYSHEEQVEWTDNIGIKEVQNKFSCDVKPFITTPPTLPPELTLPGGPYNFTCKGVNDTTIVLTTATAAGAEDETTYVEKVTFAEGQFKFKIDLPSGFEGVFRLEIPQLTLPGAQASFSRDINTSTETAPYIIDLAGATIETDLIDGKHKMEIKSSFEIGGSTDLGQAANDTEVTVEYAMSGIKVSKLFGYFGQQDPKGDEEGEIDLDFFDDFKLTGQFDFTGIEIDATVSNKLGIPLQVNGSFDMYRDEDKINQSLTLTPPFGLKVNSATYDNASETVTAVTTNFRTSATLALDGNNLPNKLKFKVTGQSNPNPGTDGKKNFLVKGGDEESLVDVALNLRIPIHFKTSQYTRQDTIKFDYKDIVKDNEEKSDAIDEVILTLTIDNGLPLGINLGMSALGADGQRLTEEIISSQVIEAGVPTGNGNQITSSHYVLTIRLTQKQIKEFKDRDVKNLVLETGAKTGGNDYVTLNDESFLNIDISVNATVSIPSNLF